MRFVVDASQCEVTVSVCLCVCDNCDQCSEKRSSSIVVVDLSWEVSFGGDILQMFVLDNGRMLQVVTADTGFLLLNGDCVVH